ncbi:MAG: hypothetical protein ACUVV0_12940 [Anaerolineae bacterium]
MRSKITFLALALGILTPILCVLLCLVAGLALAPTMAEIWSSLILPQPSPTPIPVIIYKPLKAEELSTEEILAETVVPERDLLDLAVRLKKVEPPVRRIARDAPSHYELGDEEVFWISDQDANKNFTATATLRYITPHLYMWVQNGYEVEEEALKRSAERFENHTYPTNLYYFGSEWSPGVDSDPHVHIFNGNVPGVGGYYSSADEYPKEVNPYSNEREMFYINIDSIVPGNDYYDGILAHEFQHMIHWNVDVNEDAWVNEGLSELASMLNGYDVGGSQWAFERRPDTQLNSWADDPDSAMPNYGASYLFMFYFLERFGDEALRQLVSSQANGIQSFNEVLAARGTGLTFDDLFADWLIANCLDDPSLSDGRYGYQGLDVHLAPSQIHEEYPASRSATVHQYAADYIELKGNVRGLLIEFTGSTVAKLSDKDPHSGSYEWWSNRGDESDMTLTRAFDLSKLEKATLLAWLWYDIEEGWDYAYIEASTDGGKTWEALKGLHTTDANPNGNNLGWAYTGIPKSCPHPKNPPVGPAEAFETEKPCWVQEKIDLTPYVGREILLRFEYVTDDAVNRPGFFVDDISIPELGYYDDVERGTGGWQARGFIRSNNFVPQRFLVQLIEFSPEPNVRRMSIDKRGKGWLQVSQQAERAVLVVSALAPATTEWASYEYSLSQAKISGLKEQR